MTELAPFAIRVLPAHENTTRIVVAGELDLVSAPALGLALDRELAAAAGVVLDLSQVQFIDSTGLHAIIRALESARAGDRSLVIAAPLPPQAQRLFEVVGLLDKLPLVD